MKTRTHAERILRSAAFQYADARMTLQRNPENWSGFHAGRACAALSILTLFLRDQPRRVQLEIGTKIRNEIAKFKADRLIPAAQHA
jgi:hypothetical protein